MCLEWHTLTPAVRSMSCKQRIDNVEEHTNVIYNGDWRGAPDETGRSTRAHYSASEPTSLCSFSLMLCAKRGSKKKWFGLTRHAIYLTRGEHADHYTTYAVIMYAKHCPEKNHIIWSSSRVLLEGTCIATKWK
jgi:hypothetical protein